MFNIKWITFRESRVGFIETRSLAALLGVKPRRGHAVDTLELARRVGKGLSVDAIDRLCKLIAPDDTGFRYRIVPKATLARRQQGNGRLSPEESDRLARLARLWAVALDVWKSEEATRRFLARPHPLLRNSIPRELVIESEIGARAVENVIGGLKYGTAV
jgi:putative toxin-antitoxin system antitoxin component (TIGR02293 family)